MNSARICLTEDTDPPVIVEAAIALQFLIEKQEGCELFFSVLLALKKVALHKNTLWKEKISYFMSYFVIGAAEQKK